MYGLLPQAERRIRLGFGILGFPVGKSEEPRQGSIRNGYIWKAPQNRQSIYLLSSRTIKQPGGRHKRLGGMRARLKMYSHSSFPSPRPQNKQYVSEDLGFPTLNYYWRREGASVGDLMVRTCEVLGLNHGSI